MRHIFFLHKFFVLHNCQLSLHILLFPPDSGSTCPFFLVFCSLLLTAFCIDISHETGFTSAGPRDVESLKNFVLNEAEKAGEAKLQAD